MIVTRPARTLHIISRSALLLYETACRHASLSLHFSNLVFLVIEGENIRGGMRRPPRSALA